MARWSMILAAAMVAGLALFFLNDDSSSRNGRREDSQREVARQRRAAEERQGDAERSAEMADRIAALIKKHGAFVAKGHVELLRPLGPGAGLDVRLEGDVEVKGTTDADGRFVLPPLPRFGEYRLVVEGERVRPFERVDISAPDADELDLGDILMNRYYFIKGRVLGDGRVGIATAEVALTDPPSGSAFSFMRASKETATEDPVVAQAAVGEDGSFTLKLSQPGIYVVRARADGWANRYAREVVVGGETDVELMLAMTRGHPVVGYVLDAAGRPARASVTLYAAGWGMSAWPKEVAQTDGAGRFEFRVEPNAREYVLSVVPDSGVNLSKRFRVPLNEDLVLTLPGTGSLTGRIVDANTQQPVAGAEVLVAIGSGRMPDFSKALTTDAYGSFRVTGLGAGKLQSVSVRAEGYADMRASRWMPTDPEVWSRLQTVELSADSEVALGDIPVQQGRVLFGIVTEEGTGEAVAGADVQLWDFIMGNRSARTDESGQYRFIGVSDRIALIVEREGYASMRDQPFPGYQLEGDAQEVRRDVALSRGASLSGVVKGSDGKPLRGALVRLQPAARGWQAMMAAMSVRGLWGHTNEKGEYRIEGVPPMRIKVEADLAGYDKTSSKERDVKPGEVVEKLDIAMQPAASLEGMIRAREGGVVPSARITITRDPGAGANDGARWQALGGGMTAFSGEGGRFAASNVPVGKLLLRVEREGFAVTTFRREVKPGEKLADVTLTLSPAFRITGKVVNEKREPISNCWVRARHTALPDGEPVDQLLGARVESDGTFTLAGLPDGSYEIEVRVARWGQTSGPRYENLKRPGVNAGTQGLVLELAVASE